MREIPPGRLICSLPRHRAIPPPPENDTPPAAAGAPGILDGAFRVEGGGCVYALFAIHAELTR